MVAKESFISGWTLETSWHEEGLWIFSRSSTFLEFMRCAASRRRRLAVHSRQALRKSVARLAQEMGEPLFEARGNVLFPTAAADLLFSASRPVLSAFAQMEAELNLAS